MPEPSEGAAPALHRPASLSDLFFSMTLLALQGFGGVLAVVQRELVEKKQWMSREEFVEEWAVAQIMPGPNVVNLSLMIGHRFFGLRGALTAVAGMLCFPLVVILLLAVLYSKLGANEHVAGALRGMGAVAAGLIAATGLKLIAALRTHPMGMALVALFAVATFAAIALLRLPLVWVLPVLGGLSCVITWTRLGARK